MRNENIEDDGEIIEFMNNIVEKVNTPKDAITETIKVSAKIKEYVEQAQKEINNIYGKIAAITEGNHHGILPLSSSLLSFLSLENQTKFGTDEALVFQYNVRLSTKLTFHHNHQYYQN